MIKLSTCLTSFDIIAFYNFGQIFCCVGGFQNISTKAMTVPDIYSNIPDLQPHESIDMYILVFHKEHINAGHMELAGG